MHSPVEGLLLDMDGVLMVEGWPLPGSLEALRALLARHIPFRILSNKTLQPHAALVRSFQEMGVALPPEYLITPPTTARRWLLEQGTPQVALFLQPQVWQDFAGLPLLPEEAESGADYVIVGDMGAMWTYSRLNRALRLLLNGGRLVALGMGRYWRAQDGVRLDTGAFVNLLAFASGQTPKVIGKPAREYFLDAVRQLGLPPERVAMVGDDVISDVQAAQEAGIRGVLVRTGKFREADLRRGVVPDKVVADVRDALLYLFGWSNF